MKNPLIRCGVVIGAAALLSLSSANAMLSVSDAFDNGRVAVVAIDQTNRVVRTTIPPDNHTQDSRMRFWHMRIDGIVPGEEITLRHTPSVNMHYVYSYDGESWHRFPTPGVDPLRYRFAESSVYIALNIPYSYGRSLSLAAEFAGHPAVSVSDLATSGEGRAVKLFCIHNDNTSYTEKRVVWIIARQHAFESPSSLVAEGFLRWMASPDEAAAVFRQRAVAYVVPIMDVDNVFHGLTGKDQPDDFNRVWDRNPAPWEAVRAARDRMLADAEGNRFLGLIDSHNPFYTQGPHWHVSATPAAWASIADAFQAGIVAAGRANWHGNAVQTMEPHPNSSAVARRWGMLHLGGAPDFVSATLESPHHRDSEGRFMTEEGYLQWGEAIGRAFNDVLAATEPVDPPPVPPLPIAYTLLIDFGDAAEAPVAGGTWNTVPGNPPPTIGGLVLADDRPASGISLHLEGFQATALDQGAWPTGDRGWVDARATADYLWRGSGGTATVTITGLPPEQPHTVEIVAARASGDNRLGAYRVQGQETDVESPSGAFHTRSQGWEAGHLLRWEGVRPDAAGSIRLTLTPASGMTVLVNALRLVRPLDGHARSFRQWRETHFDSAGQADPDVSGPAAQPAGDGLANLFRFAVGRGPFEEASSLLPRLVRGCGEATGCLRYVFVRRGDGSQTPAPAASIDGVSSSVEFSPDLAAGSWTSLGDQPTLLGPCAPKSRPLRRGT
jgi:hypothetical protein